MVQWKRSSARSPDFASAQIRQHVIPTRLLTSRVSVYPLAKGRGGQKAPQGPEWNLTVCSCLSSPPASVQQVPTLQHLQIHQALTRGGEMPPPRPGLPPREAAPTRSTPHPRRARWAPFSPLRIATAVNPTLIYGFFNKRLLCSFLGPKMQGDRSCLAQHDTPRFSILLTIQYAPQSFSE